MRIFAFLFLLISMSLQAQTSVSGVVRDSETKSTLAFATITPENGTAIITDVDGKFSFKAPAEIITFTVTYTGYEPQTIKISSSKKYYSIRLKPHTEELETIVINGVNPANEIIRQAINRKALNDPQQKLSSFRYRTYDRLVVTADPDSIRGLLDSVYVYEKAVRRFEKIDSADFKFKKLISTQHLYQTEKVSEFKFNRDIGLKETVIATRMAGFKQPLYEFIGLKLQSYSVYTKNIDLFETKYQGPVSDGALSEYHYKLLDTVSIDNR
ncbi:MAG: carboxypeptidase-like regulatory domain-containing protein, partial [Flavobacterium sp.]